MSRAGALFLIAVGITFNLIGIIGIVAAALMMRRQGIAPLVIALGIETFGAVLLALGIVAYRAHQVAGTCRFGRTIGPRFRPRPTGQAGVGRLAIHRPLLGSGEGKERPSVEAGDYDAGSGQG